MAGKRRWRFGKRFVLLGALAGLTASLVMGGCSVLSPESRIGYVPSYVTEKCEAPLFRGGDTWRFVGSKGREWEEKVVEDDAGLKVVQNEKKEFYGITFSIGEFELQKFFPLWVGKEWRGSPLLNTVQGFPLTYSLVLRVMDYTLVHVRAGAFRCYVIELRLSYSLDRGIGYYYYAPETKSIVKFETKSPFLFQWENYELVAYSVSKAP